MVHFGFKLRVLSHSQTVGSREETDRDFMFPSGETEAKTDERVNCGHSVSWGYGTQCPRLELQLSQGCW